MTELLIGVGLGKHTAKFNGYSGGDISCIDVLGYCFMHWCDGIGHFFTTVCSLILALPSFMHHSCELLVL